MQTNDTKTNLANIVPEIWSSNYYDALLATLPFNAVVSRAYEGEIQNVGDTVRITTFEEFDDALELEETAAGVTEAATLSQQSLVVDSRIYKDFILTNKATLQSLPAMDKLQELAIYAILKKFQKKIIDASVPSASSPNHQGSYASGTTLALADIVGRKKLLDAANVDKANRHCVLGTNQSNDIFSLAQFTSSDFVVGANLITTGVVGNPLLGFQPHSTTEVGDTSYFFHASYFAVAAQKALGVEAFNLGVNGVRGVRINVDTLAGFKQLSNIRVATLS